MKITPCETQPTALNGVHERKGAAPAGAAPAATATAAEPSATVELSSAALLASGGADASFDTEKVERVSKAIQDGSFKVNADTIADKLIANARELLSKTYR